MIKLGKSGELLLQKHIRIGRVNSNTVILINVVIAIIMLIGTTLGIAEVVPDSYRWVSGVWLLWGFFGAAISHKSNFAPITDHIVSLPAMVSTYLAAYFISSIYWVMYKIFGKQ